MKVTIPNHDHLIHRKMFLFCLVWLFVFVLFFDSNDGFAVPVKQNLNFLRN